LPKIASKEFAGLSIIGEGHLRQKGCDNIRIFVCKVFIKNRQQTHRLNVTDSAIYLLQKYEIFFMFAIAIITMALIKSISGIRGTIGGKPGKNLVPGCREFTAAYGTWLMNQGKAKR
jgi:hypothetical protein